MGGSVLFTTHPIFLRS